MPPTWPMIQLLGNGRGQYGSTRNAGLWALAGKAAKIMAVSAAIKKVHQDFSMISSLVIRLSRPTELDDLGRRGATIFLHTLALHLPEEPSCAICGLGPDNDRAPAQSGTAMLTTDGIFSYSWRTMP